GTRPSHDADRSGSAALSGLAARFGLELLNSVRERDRHGSTGNIVQVAGAIQDVFGAQEGIAACAARCRGSADADYGNPTEPSGLIAAGLNGCAAQANQVGDVAAIQWQLDDALGLNHLTDAQVAGLNQRRIRLHTDLFT